jgi:hypothetical protein
LAAGAVVPAETDWALASIGCSTSKLLSRSASDCLKRRAGLRPALSFAPATPLVAAVHSNRSSLITVFRAQSLYGG